MTAVTYYSTQNISGHTFDRLVACRYVPEMPKDILRHLTYFPKGVNKVVITNGLDTFTIFPQLGQNNG